MFLPTFYECFHKKQEPYLSCFPKISIIPTYKKCEEFLQELEDKIFNNVFLFLELIVLLHYDLLITFTYFIFA